MRSDLSFDAVPRKDTGNMTLLQVFSVFFLMIFLRFNAARKDFLSMLADQWVSFQIPVQQMIGRAGRPGFDVEGHAIIMTEVHNPKFLFVSLPWVNLVLHGQ
jgi:hypothetical protein